MNHTAVYYKLLKQQEAWAKKRNLSLSRWRVPNLDDNLYVSLHPETRSEYEKAGGRELEEKFFSIISSAALACNVFDFWRHQGRADVIAKCCGITGPVAGLRFESPFEIFHGTPPASPDIVFFDGPRSEKAKVLTAIETKFAEPYRRSDGPCREPFSKSYFRDSSAGIWEGLSATRSLAEAIQLRWESNPACQLFEYLDAAQLIKHAIGLNLASKEGKRFTLTYLWYEVCDDDKPTLDSKRHQQEIVLFRNNVAREFAFSDLEPVSKMVRVKETKERWFGHREVEGN